jgi:hypothetical protein
MIIYNRFSQGALLLLWGRKKHRPKQWYDSVWTIGEAELSPVDSQAKLEQRSDFWRRGTLFGSRVSDAPELSFQKKDRALRRSRAAQAASSSNK